MSAFNFRQPKISLQLAIVEGLDDWELTTDLDNEFVDLNSDLEGELLTTLAGMFPTVNWIPRTLMELRNAELWVMQAVADLSNVSAKTVGYDFYNLKDWVLLAITEMHFHEMQVGYSCGYPEVVIKTERFGTSSYHCPGIWHPSWDCAKPVQKSWSGVRRQFGTYAIVQDPQLMRVVAYVTNVSAGPNDPLVHRVNDLLDRRSAA